MCLHTQSQDETISIHTYTNEFGVTTVRIHYGPIRFIITSTLRPVVHQRMDADNESITVTLYFQQTRTKLYFRFQATEHRWTNSGTMTVMIDYRQTGMHWCVYFSCLATSYTHQQCPLLVSKHTPYSIPIPESEWGRRNRSELVLDWRPPPREVYGALLSDTDTSLRHRNPPQPPSTLLQAPIQESQPYDQTKSEAVFPPLQL